MNGIFQKCTMSVVLSVSLFFSSSVFSLTINQEQLEHYFSLSGINDLLTSVPEQLQEMRADAEVEYGHNSSDVTILSALIKAWDYPAIKSQLTLALEQSLTPKQLSALLAWQNGKLAQQIKQKDELTSDENFEHNFALFVTRLPSSMPDAKHVSVIHEMIDAKQMVEAMVDLTMSVSRPVMLALIEAENAQEEGMTLDTIEQQMIELEQLLIDDLSNQIALLSYYLYKDVSVNDLSAYAQFYQSELGQLELAVLNKALHQSIALWQSFYAQTVHFVGDKQVVISGE